MFKIILDSLYGVRDFVGGFLPMLLAVLTVVVLGTIITRIVSQLIHRLLTELKVDQLMHQIGLDGVLHKGGLKHSTVDIIRSMIHWVLMVTVVIMGVKSMGLTVVDDVLNRIFGYVPHVISGITVLVLGMITANFVSTFIKLVARYTEMPKPELLGSLSKWAIVIFTGLIFLEEIGLGALLVGTPFQYLFGAFCLALALAFGLGGRDAASRTIEKLRK